MLFPYIIFPLFALAHGVVIPTVAILVLFYPLRFVGIRPYIGWKGIVPANAASIATAVVRASLGNLASPREVFEKLDTSRMQEHFVASLGPWLDVYTRDVIFAAYPRLNKFLPDRIKRLVAAQIRAQLPRVIDDIMATLVEEIDDLLDIEWLATTTLVQRPRLLVHIFRTCGRRELRGIVVVGGLLGLLGGLIQAMCWFLQPSPWTMLLLGSLTGALATTGALAYVFAPRMPVHIGPWRLQGAFFRHQSSISSDFCHLVAHHVLTLPHIARTLLEGPQAPRVRAIITDALNRTIDDTIRGTESIRHIIEAQGIDLGIDRIRHEAAQKVLLGFNHPFQDEAFATDRQNVIEAILRRRMQHAEPEEFERLLHPAFKNYEPLLIVAATAVMGAAAWLEALCVMWISHA